MTKPFLAALAGFMLIIGTDLCLWAMAAQSNPQPIQFPIA